MRRLLLIALLLSSVLCTVIAHAQELPPTVFLDKVTQRLVGRWPSPREYEALRKELNSKSCNTVTCVESFFRSYIREKMNQPEFYTLAYNKVNERFGYKSAPGSTISEILEDAFSSGYASFGRDFMLVYRTFQENKSIDELFTSQIITDPYFNDVNASSGALSHYSIDVSKMSRFMDGPKSYSFRLETGMDKQASEFDLSGHPNVSGLFSSTRFLTRYWNSPINQKRKHAAAFFRIMLCDTMSPALERETQKEKELRVALGISDEQLVAEDLEKIHLNRHATQKDCAVCHDRLDPIGRALRPLEIGISGTALKGRLRYVNGIGEMTNIPVDSFHDLMEKTTKQPKYIDCQVNWLIETYGGRDLALPPQRFTEVLNDIEKKKRRVKTVVEDILMLPEFRGIVSAVNEPQILKDTKKILSNCTECHSSFFRGRPEQLRGRFARASVCLDLPGDGKNRIMPPSSHYWEPSSGELATIKNWIGSGAPLGDGQMLFTKEEAAKVLAIPDEKVRKCRQ